MAANKDKMHVFNERLKSQALGEHDTFWKDGAIPSLDYKMLLDLLKIPVERGDTVQSGLFANALDLWIARQFERAGFDEECIWPRAVEPRAADPSLVRAISGADDLSDGQVTRLYQAGGAQTNANVMGAVYTKQVDVGMSNWLTGPELLVSTKTMSGSFGKNLANRFEEAYGDVKNLRDRYPLAAHGFFFLAHESILGEPSAFRKAVHMLRQLSRDGEVYDAVALLLVDWGPKAQLNNKQWSDVESVVLTARGIESVPTDLSCERFFAKLIGIVLQNSSIDTHSKARQLLSQ